MQRSAHAGSDRAYTPVNLWPNNEQQTASEKDAEGYTDRYSDQNACNVIQTA